MHRDRSPTGARAGAARPPRPARILLLLVLLAMPALPQGGLQAEYFDEVDLSALVQVQVDPQIDFTDWSTAPAGTDVEPDNVYSQRWTGWVLAEQAGEWTFSTYSNDGVRLWVANELLIDDWTQHSAQLDTATIQLAAGWHPLRLEHYQDGGGVVLQLKFAGPGQPTAVIPPSHLSVQPGVVAPVIEAPADRHAVVEHGPIVLAAEKLVGAAIGSWSWAQLSGPSAQLVGVDGPELRVTPLAPGEHVFAVTAVDVHGQVASDEVRVEVLELGPLGGTPHGTFRQWHKGSIDYQGPFASELGSPNPFRDYRLQVLFVHGASGVAYSVPGFFAGDGNAAESGAKEGSTWRVHFVPDRPGLWYSKASFRQGPDVALSLDPDAGTPVAFDGTSTQGPVGPPPPGATGFRLEGGFTRDGHYLVHRGSQRPFLKGGANSPENLLAYADFDQTTPSHAYAPHVGDWKPGDPTWHGDEGRGLVGALNYLASKGMNAVYFLTFNVGGDGDDVWPWVNKNNRNRFDLSKLDQWERVFEHMDDLGIAAHVVLQERENDEGPLALDGGELGVQRMLYHRELVARFGHHLGVIWNLGEETDNTTAQLSAFHDHIEALDAYDHPIVVHTNPFEKEDVYQPLLDDAVLDGASLQNAVNFETHSTTLQWRQQSAAANHPWVLAADEIGPPEVGVVPDSVDFWHDGMRKKVLWANLMAGGSGVEWYFGSSYPHDDLTCEDWRSRDHMWELTAHALAFFDALPVEQMEPHDELVESAEAWCFAEPGERYAIYMPNAGSLALDLGPSSSRFDVRWYDPGTGAFLDGALDSVQGPGVVDLDLQPAHVAEDLAVLVERDNQAPQITELWVAPDPFPGDADLVFRARVEDPDGFADVAEVRFYFFVPSGAYLWSIPGTYVGDDTWQVLYADVPPLQSGVWPWGVRALDAEGQRDIATGTFLAP